MVEVSILGVDIAKHVFQVHGSGPKGEVVFRRKVRRADFLAFLEGQGRCIVAMEACGGSHHWGREISALGHDVRLIAPAYVKPYVKRQKNDAADAEAITEAASRPTMRFVAVKSVEKQASGLVLKTRDLLTRQRTQLVNAVRGHLTEYGLVAAKGDGGVAALRQQVEQEQALPAEVVDLCALLFEQIGQLEERISCLDRRMRQRQRDNPTVQRLMGIPGIGLIVGTALAALSPPPDSFASGRDFAAWIGLTPQQHSSGGKERLGRISKRGHQYLRRLLVLGATAVIKVARRKGAPAGSWLARMLERKPPKLVAVALANKMARIAWKIMASGAPYSAAQAS